jgi:hypothetical protein
MWTLLHIQLLLKAANVLDRFSSSTSRDLCREIVDSSRLLKTNPPPSISIPFADSIFQEDEIT